MASLRYTIDNFSFNYSIQGKKSCISRLSNFIKFVLQKILSFYFHFEIFMPSITSSISRHSVFALNLREACQRLHIYTTRPMCHLVSLMYLSTIYVHCTWCWLILVGRYSSTDYAHFSEFAPCLPSTQLLGKLLYLPTVKREQI